MGKKTLALIGIGAGYYLVRKQLRDNPDGAAAKIVRTVAENPTVVAAKDKATEKSSAFVRRQGEAITDKVAESIKERLFGAPAAGDKNHANADTAEEVEVVVEEVTVAKRTN